MTDPVNAPTDPAPAAPAVPVTLDVAPVVPAVPAAAAPATPEPAGTEPVTYEPTGDRGLDMALAFIGKQGLAGDHPAVQAAADGDFTLLKAELAQKGVQGYAEFIELGEQAYARTQEKNKAQAETARKAIHDTAGGAESWAAIQAWASANASPEEKAEINLQLNKGGLAAKAAVVYLSNAYSKAGNVSQEPADVSKGGGKPASTGTGDISAADYSAAVKALNVKLKGNLEGNPEYEALNNRRLASKARGR